jgi:copper chaperone
MKESHTIQIEGVSCGHCVANIDRILSAQDGLSEISVDLDSSTAAFLLDSDKLNLQSVIQLIEETEIYTVKSN